MMIAGLLTVALYAGPTIPSRNFDLALQRRCLASTVRIRDFKTRSQGSAVVVGRLGEIVFALTAYHVVSGSDKIGVEGFRAGSFISTPTIPIPAIVVHRDEERDLALVQFTDLDLSRMLPFVEAVQFAEGSIRFPASRLSPLLGGSAYGTDVEIVRNFPAARLAFVANTGFREDPIAVLSAGCTGGNRPTCREDLADKRLLVRNGRPVSLQWETHYPTSAGRSGGPLFDESGDIVGICLAKQGGRGYYINIDEIGEFLKKRNIRLANGP